MKSATPSPPKPGALCQQMDQILTRHVSFLIQCRAEQSRLIRALSAADAVADPALDRQKALLIGTLNTISVAIRSYDKMVGEYPAPQPVRVGVDVRPDRVANEASPHLPGSAPHVGSPAPIVPPKAKRKRRHLTPEELVRMQGVAQRMRDARAEKLAQRSEYGQPKPATSLLVAPKVDLSPLLTVGAIIAREPPAEPAAPVSRAPVAQQPRTRVEAMAAISRAIDTRKPVDAGYGAADSFQVVRAWADARGIAFASWDDLPGVNRRRERAGLADFKRAFPTKGVVG